ncbi:MAG: amidohydrolase family protein [Chthoniobacterales bacterium]
MRLLWVIGFLAGSALVRGAEPPLAITNVTVIDPAGAGRIGERTVLVEAGRIAAIEAADTTQIPENARRVEGRGLFLVPGLTDMHVHLFNNSTHRPPNEWAFPMFIANGATAVREMRTGLDDLPRVARWREEVANGRLIAPHVIAAGVAVWGTYEEGAREEVRAAKTAGADFIKVFSDVPATHWRVILAEAKSLGIPVCGHVPAQVSLLEAARAGQRSNEHLTQAYEACSAKEDEWLAARRGLAPDTFVALRDSQEREVLATFDEQACAQTATALAATGQAQVPTLVLSHFEARGEPSKLRDDPRWNLLRQDEQKRWLTLRVGEAAADRATSEERRTISCRIVHAFRNAGVTILAGTDAPMPLVYPGFSLHDELELLVECGLTPLDALRAATSEPAKFLGRDGEFGSIAVGQRADMILLEADPLQDIRNLRRIRAVILGGRLLRQADLKLLSKKGLPTIR